MFPLYKVNLNSTANTYAASLCIRFQEIPNRITPMPTRSINIQPDSIAAKSAIKVLQHLEKSFPVSAFRLDHSSTAQKWSHPAGNETVIP